MVFNEIFGPDRIEEFDQVKNDVIFKNVVFRSMDMRAAGRKVFENCAFINCTFREMNETVMKDCVIRGGRVDRSSGNSGLVAHNFSSFGTDFYSFDLRGAEFLSGVTFEEGSMRDCDVEGMVVDGVISNVKFEGLKGHPDLRYARIEDTSDEKEDQNEFVDSVRSDVLKEVNQHMERFNKFTQVDPSTGKRRVDYQAIKSAITLELNKRKVFFAQELRGNPELLASLRSGDVEKTKQNIRDYMRKTLTEYQAKLRKEIMGSLKFSLIQYPSAKARSNYVEARVRQFRKEEEIRKRIEERMSYDASFAEEEALKASRASRYADTVEKLKSVPEAGRLSELEEAMEKQYAVMETAEEAYQEKMLSYRGAADACSDMYAKILLRLKKSKVEPVIADLKKDPDKLFEELANMPVLGSNRLRSTRKKFGTKSPEYNRLHARYMELYEKNLWNEFLTSAEFKSLVKVQPGYKDFVKARADCDARREECKAAEGLFRKQESLAFEYEDAYLSYRESLVAKYGLESLLPETKSAEEENSVKAVKKVVASVQDKESYHASRELKMKELLDAKDAFKKALVSFNKGLVWSNEIVNGLEEKKKTYVGLLKEFKQAAERSEQGVTVPANQAVSDFLGRVESDMQDPVERVNNLRGFMSRIRNVQSELSLLEKARLESKMRLDAGNSRSAMEKSFHALAEFDANIKKKYNLSQLLVDYNEDEKLRQLGDAMGYAGERLEDAERRLKLFQGDEEERKNLEKERDGYRDCYQGAVDEMSRHMDARSKRQEGLALEISDLLPVDVKARRDALAREASNSFTTYLFQNRELLAYNDLVHRCEEKRQEMMGIVAEFKAYDKVMAARFLDKLQGERDLQEIYVEKGQKKGYDGAHIHELNKKAQRERDDRDNRDDRDFTEYGRLRREKWNQVLLARNAYFSAARSYKESPNKTQELLTRRNELYKAWKSRMDEYRKFKSLQDKPFENGVVTVTEKKLDPVTGKEVSFKEVIPETVWFEQIHQKNLAFVREIRRLENRIVSVEQSVVDTASKMVDARLRGSMNRKNSSYLLAKEAYEKLRDSGVSKQDVYLANLELGKLQKQFEAAKKAYDTDYQACRKKAEREHEAELKSLKEDLEAVKKQYDNWKSQKTLKKYIAYSEYRRLHSVELSMAKEETEQSVGRAASGVLDYSDNRERAEMPRGRMRAASEPENTVVNENVSRGNGLSLDLDFEYRFYLRSKSMDGDRSKLFALLDDVEAKKDDLLKERAFLANALILKALPSYNRVQDPQDMSSGDMTVARLGFYSDDEVKGRSVSVEVCCNNNTGDAYYKVSGRCERKDIKALREAFMHDELFAGLSVYNGDVRVKSSSCIGVNDFGVEKAKENASVPFDYRLYMTSAAMSDGAVKLFPLLDELEAKEPEKKVILMEQAVLADSTVASSLSDYGRVAEASDYSEGSLTRGLLGSFTNENVKNSRLIVEACSDNLTGDAYYRLYGVCGAGEKGKIENLAMHGSMFQGLVVYDGDRLAKGRKVGLNDSVGLGVSAVSVDLSDLGNGDKDDTGKKQGKGL